MPGREYPLESMVDSPNPDPIKLFQTKIIYSCMLFFGTHFQTWLLEAIPVSVKSLPIFRLSDQNC